MIVPVKDLIVLIRNVNLTQSGYNNMIIYTCVPFSRLYSLCILCWQHLLIFCHGL